jgi:hypothetical protein
MKQMFIWSSEVVFDEQTKSEMQESKRELLGDDSYILSEEDIADELQQELEDERCNLNKTIDGVIIVFGDLGLWNGRRQGYQILGNNIANILYSQCEIAEWYGDGYNIRGRMSHHDGTNYTLYRIAKDNDDAERIAEMIYNNEIDEASDAELVLCIRTWQRCTDGRYADVEITSTDSHDGRCSMIDVYYAAASFYNPPGTFLL